MIQRSIHYKSDFKLRLANEIDWSTPFKARFFTTRPVSAMEVSYDGTTYKGCRVDEEGKLVVTFDRFTQLHRQGLGNLMMELTYNIDDDQFADNSFDRILAPQKVVCTDDEDNEFELVLGLNGDSNVEVECSVIAAYKKGDPGDTPEIGENGNWWIGGVDTEVKADYSSEEALRQSQEAARVAAETARANAETTRQSNEAARQSAETTRANAEATRQTNEAARQSAETQRQQTFQTNEAARQTAYQNAEANRNGAYQEAEQDRDEEFASKEATRDAANQAALDCADTLAELGPKIDKVDDKVTFIPSTTYRGYINGTTNPQWTDLGIGGRYYKIIPIPEGSETMYVKAGANATAVAFLSSYAPTEGGDTGIISATALNGNAEFRVRIPSTAKYIYVLWTSGSDRKPAILEFDDINCYSELKQEFFELKGQNGKYITDGTYLWVLVDGQDKVLEAIKMEGRRVFNLPVKMPSAEIGAAETCGTGFEIVENPEFIKVETDGKNAILIGIRKNGDVYFGCKVPSQIKEYVDSIKEEANEALAELETGEPITNDILYQNPYQEMFEKISSLLRDSNRVNARTTFGRVLCLLHFSDLHNDEINLLRIKAFCDRYSAYINDVIQTGDINNQFYEGMPAAYEETKFILNVVGNHEATNRIGTPPNHTWVTQSTKDCYDYIMKPYISAWGVTQPSDAATEGKCYYYKDYATKSVRLIVLDNIPTLGGGPSHWDATQKAWLESVLAETLDENNSAYGYHVVVALHYPPFEPNQVQGNPFTSPSIAWSSGYQASSDIANAVGTFIDNGGVFVCYLCGHLHNDFFGFGKLSQYQNQFVICVDCAGVDAANTVSLLQRTRNEKNQDSFNIIGIDTDLHIVKLFRVGAQYDYFLRKHDTICFDYINSTIINY